MPGRRSGVSGSASSQRITIAGKSFASRQAAVRFLQDNPDLVKYRLGNLLKGSPKLLKAAGYRVYTANTGGGGWLLKDDEPIMDFERLPRPVPTAGRTLRADTAGRRAIERGVGSKLRTPDRTPPRTATQNAAAQGPVAVADPVSADPGIDYETLAANTGIDPVLLKGLGPNIGSFIPLSLARRGAKPMNPDEIDDLIGRLVGDSYSAQTSILESERERMGGQNQHNLDQIERWYGQVIDSQGVAAQRDREFGRAAVTSAEDSTRGIISALGGEANEGSYAVGQAGQENIGNINAISTIQDQYNADLAPLLAGEKAGQLAREQALGDDRLRDLTERLTALSSERGSKEAEMRYSIWQNNNDILDRRLQNELAIRQANTGLRQQRFANNMGVRQMTIAAQAAAGDNMVDLAGLAQNEAEAYARSADKERDRSFRWALEQAKEAGRDRRARIAAQDSNTPKNKSYGSVSEATRESALTDILDVLEGADDMSPAEAQKVAIAVIGGYGWSVRNPAVAAFVTGALRQAGY